MADYLGEVAPGSTIEVWFTTLDSVGAPIAPSSAFEADDVVLYKNGSATQRASTSGWTMTSPFDSITGLHCLAIDLSDNTDPGFYTPGGRYTAVLAPDETVDGHAVLSVLARFAIGPTSTNVLLRTGIAQGGAAGSITLDSGASSVDSYYNECIVAIVAGTGAGQSRYIGSYAGSTRVASIEPNWVTNPNSTSVFAVLPFGRIGLGRWRGSIPNLMMGGRVDVTVGAMQADVVTAAAIAADAIGASELAADAVTEIQSGLATSSALSTVAGYIDTEVAAILAAVDTEVAAIKAKTDNLPAAPAATGDIPTATENADALLKRDMSAVTGESDRSPLNALRAIRNKSAISAGTLSVYKEDDSTAAWTATVTTAAGDPLASVDPS